MKIEDGVRFIPGVLALLALIFSAFAHPAAFHGDGGEHLSSFLSVGDEKQSPGPPPGSPEHDPLSSEEPEGSGDDDDFEDRFHIAGSSPTPVGQDLSTTLPEWAHPLPVRRRFLEFCTLKLDCQHRTAGI